MSARTLSLPFDPAVAWHDVECGGYAADLPLWRELAARAEGPVLELGAGTGRVSLDLAARGHRVTALDSDPAFVAACAARARARGLRVDAVCADARTFSIERRFALVIAPMQLVQLLDSAGRSTMLARALAHVSPGGLLAAALADPLAGAPAGESLPPAPDIGEVAGWALASAPVAVREEPAAAERVVAIDRMRRAVAPDGESVEEAATVRLAVLSPDELASAGAGHGFLRLPDRHVPETDDYVGSTVVVLQAPAESGPR